MFTESWSLDRVMERAYYASSVFFFGKYMKIMLVMTNYAKHYASTIFQSLVLGCAYPNRGLPWTWRYSYKWTKKLSSPADGRERLLYMFCFCFSIPNFFFHLLPSIRCLRWKMPKKEDRKTHAKRVNEKRNVWSTAGEKQIFLNCRELEVADSPIFFDILIL